MFSELITVGLIITLIGSCWLCTPPQLLWLAKLRRPSFPTVALGIALTTPTSNVTSLAEMFNPNPNRAARALTSAPFETTSSKSPESTSSIAANWVGDDVGSEVVGVRVGDVVCGTVGDDVVGAGVIGAKVVGGEVVGAGVVGAKVVGDEVVGAGVVGVEVVGDNVVGADVVGDNVMGGGADARLMETSA